MIKIIFLLLVLGSSFVLIAQNKITFNADLAETQISAKHPPGHRKLGIFKSLSAFITSFRTPFV
jgi:hypothetical protein